MSKIDINKVINGTSQKLLINAFEKMKMDYSKESAEEYFQSYKDSSLPFILENSEYIFVEPYCGLKFYESVILNPNNCIFTHLTEESDKVSDYINSHSDMPENQKILYESLQDKISTLLEHTKNTRIYANYIKDRINESFEDELSSTIYSGNDVGSVFESCDNSLVKYVYSVYTNNSSNAYVDTLTGSVNINQDTAEDKWDSFVESVLCINKLYDDSAFVEAVSRCDKNVRDLTKFVANISLESVIDEYRTINVKEEDVLFSSFESAINNIFDDIYEESLGINDKSMNDSYNKMMGSIYEHSLNILLEEYQTMNGTDKLVTNELATSYPFIESGLNIEIAYDVLLDKYRICNPNYFEEATEEDDESNNIDDELESLKLDNGKKIKAPVAKNNAVKIQNKYMDKEAHSYAKKAERKQQGQEIKNAVNAVTRLPKNVMIDIKNQIHQLDEKDDERRKNYMTEPGFRKKAFRNLKLAIIYGSAASVKLSLIPIVATCRHFSKTKDIRVRNELVRELETEIKVTEEKISDASANGDQKEKYRLMRIRDQLNAEMVRVRLNSKYV